MRLINHVIAKLNKINKAAILLKIDVAYTVDTSILYYSGDIKTI